MGSLGTMTPILAPIRRQGALGAPEVFFIINALQSPANPSEAQALIDCLRIGDLSLAGVLLVENQSCLLLP